MSLRDEIAQYTELSGNDGAHTPIGIIGAYLDGYEKGKASARQTVLGYPVEHLMLIAEVMRKENVTPEKVMEVLADAGRIASMVRAEFEEQLRKAVERCWTN